ncbi:MAG: hypothetical protein PF589_02530 [Gammaproteobacteria bacterium]|jgi:hypothetical protein|nr:hypothetical protein [Gammaproteobacteria bacterium]
MIISKFLSALIDELKRLYNQLSLAQLYRRMHGYHNQNKSFGNAPATDIRSSLSECINNIIIKHEADGPAVITPHPVSTSTVHHSATEKHPVPYPFRANSETDKNSRYAVNTRQINDLVKYFKTKENDAELHPAIKDKLRRSIWEHINAAIECALMGDRRNAKMHVDIANYAFQEVAHYMSEEQYRLFATTLDEHLSALNADD